MKIGWRSFICVNDTNVYYVIVSIIKSRIAVEIVDVEYDVEQAAKAIEDMEALPDEFADMLSTGGH